jgi:hypothetical protein
MGFAIEEVIEAVIVKELRGRLVDAPVGLLTCSREKEAKVPQVIAERQTLPVRIETA